MRALRTRRHHPLFRSGDLIEKSSRELKLPRQESHRISLFANPKASDRLDSWKEIASHLKRTVRTVQRWERHEGLPVHRHLHQRANSVYARKSELDEWWNHEPHCIEIERLRVASEGFRPEVSSPQALKVIPSEMGSGQVIPRPPELHIDCIQESPEAEIISAEDGTGCVVYVLRVRIRIEGRLLQAGLENTTRGAKALCRTLSLAASCRPV
jgi:hypothetical protein